MPKARLLVAALVVVTVAVILFVALTPSTTPTGSRPAEATGVVLRGYDGGSLTWEAEAERGEIASESGTLSGIVLRMVDGSASPLEVSALELKQETGKLTLTGNVHGETDDGLSIASDEMTWQEDARRLESGPTLLRWGEDELLADSLAYDARTRQASLTGVEGTLHRESTLVLSSDRGEISEDRILLAGEVRAASDDESLRSDELETDLRGTDVMLRGAVSVSAPGLELRADSLRVTPEGRTATGNVSLDIEIATGEEDHGA